MRHKGGRTSMKFKYISLLLSLFASRCNITEGNFIQGFSVHLVGSSLRYAGRIEIKTDSWSSICDVGWNMKNAHVVCRELGYIEAEAAILGEAFGPAPGQISMKQFRCNGNERFLLECPSNDSINTSCSKRTVAAVLCTPATNFFFQISIISAVLCLAITSIIIFRVTCRTMHLRRLIEKLKSSRRLPTNVSNLNEEIIKADEDKDEERSDLSGKTLENAPSNAECKEPSQEGNNIVYKKEKTLSTPSDPELIISTCNEEDHHAHDNKGRIQKNKTSRRKSRYMRLKRRSAALIHSYTKLLEKNRNRNPTKAVDYPDDCFSFRENKKDGSTVGSFHDTTNVNSTWTGECNEIYSHSEENKHNVDKEGYVGNTLKMKVAAEVQNPLQEYLDILPPTILSKANNSISSGKRNSEYLDPVETNLTLYPESFDKMPLSSYNDELPDPPKECEAFLGNSLGLDNTECWCNKNLICNRCLNNKYFKKKEGSDEDFVYMQMGHFSTESSKKAGVQESIRRNRIGYEMPRKKSKEVFSEGLKKTLLKQNTVPTLPQSVNTKLKPNETHVYDKRIESRGEEEAKEKGNNALSTPNEKTSNNKSSQLEITKPPQATLECQFSANRDYFENQAAIAARSLTRPFDSKDGKPKTALKPVGNEADGKFRSESFPVELAETSVSPNPLFMKSLEIALKSNTIMEKRRLEKKSLARDESLRENQTESDSENDYELDYEAIFPPKNPHYVNNDLYLNKGPGFTGSRPDSDECEYDYVDEKQRSSSHFYEAVAKESDEDDQYEQI